MHYQRNYDIIEKMGCSYLMLRAEKTPFEPDLGHASVGKYIELHKHKQFLSDHTIEVNICYTSIVTSPDEELNRFL